MLCHFTDKKARDNSNSVTKTKKAVVARRYPRQGKAIRQVASPSSLC